MAKLIPSPFCSMCLYVLLVKYVGLDMRQGDPLVIYDYVSLFSYALCRCCAPMSCTAGQ